MITPVFNPHAPNKVYGNAGVNIITKGFTVSQCTHLNNNFCTFSVSTNAPANLALSGPSGTAIVTVCLNGTGDTSVRG